MSRWVLLTFAAVMLAACGTTPEPPPHVAMATTPTATATATPTATPPPVPLPTATSTATATPTATPTSVPLPTATSTATPTPTPTPWPTSTPWPTATPTSTQVPGRDDLYAEIDPPEHMAWLWWGWDRAESERGFEEMEIAFTVHDDVGDLPGINGLYLILCYGFISDRAYYFGLQSNTHSATLPVYDRGKGVVFSRWGTRDLALARYSEDDGWTQSSGHEGDFIGVRRLYEWGPGDYVARLAPDGREREGQWFGLWLTDVDAGTTTWIGSLRFPTVEGEARIGGPVYSTVEIYGGAPTRPLDIPVWHVSITRPSGDGVPVRWGRSGYGMFDEDIRNSDISYERREGLVHIRVGGLTERESAPWEMSFD